MSSKQPLPSYSPLRRRQSKTKTADSQKAQLPSLEPRPWNAEVLNDKKLERLR